MWKVRARSGRGLLQTFVEYSMLSRAVWHITKRRIRFSSWGTSAHTRVMSKCSMRAEVWQSAIQNLFGEQNYKTRKAAQVKTQTVNQNIKRCNHLLENEPRSPYRCGSWTVKLVISGSLGVNVCSHKTIFVTKDAICLQSSRSRIERQDTLEIPDTSLCFAQSLSWLCCASTGSVLNCWKMFSCSNYEVVYESLVWCCHCTSHYIERFGRHTVSFTQNTRRP